MRKPIIVGNWKMNKLRGDAKEFVCAIEEYLTGEEASMVKLKLNMMLVKLKKLFVNRFLEA